MAEAVDQLSFDEDFLRIELEIRDPELVRELRAHHGVARDDYALAALRLGLLALRQARGELDAETIKREGERLMGGIEQRLSAHQQAVEGHLAEVLRTYFDPEDGRFAERVERLVRRDGELESLLRRHVGAEDSELARGLEQSLGAQRERVLREFSLDHKEGALSRLVGELEERHGKLSEDFRGRLQQVVGEFSLDREDSALARMNRHLTEVLKGHREDAERFQTEVREALAAMSARKEESLRSTRHGVDFEEAVVAFAREDASRRGDVATHTGNTTGAIRHCKVGDVVLELGPEAAAAGARMVLEAKQDAGYDLARARAELDTARKNREAEVGVFVFSARAAPEGLEPMMRFGPDIVTVWDAEEPATDVYLRASLSLARALCAGAGAARDAEARKQVDLTALHRAIRGVEKQAEGLEEIRRWAETARSSGEKIGKRADYMRRQLGREVEQLDELLIELRQLAGNSAGD